MTDDRSNGRTGRHRARPHGRTTAAAKAGSLLGGVGVVVGAALPWLETGGTRRSAFDLARVANDLGVLDRASLRVAALALFLMPMVMGLFLILIGLGRRRLAAMCSLGVGLVGLTAGGVGLGASSTGANGPMVTLVGSIVSTAASLVLLVRRRDPAVDEERYDGVGRHFTGTDRG